MIDIHCHILPEIDDGAKTVEEALSMLRAAERAGITDIILTPHYMRGTVYNANNARKWQIYQDLCEKAKLAGISTKLYLGNEIYIDERLPAMLKGYTGEEVEPGDEIYEIATLNSKKYALVEFPVQFKDKSAKETLFSLIQRGLVPVIAHPERYHYVQENPECVDEFLQMGCVLQGDYLALTGKYGKRAEKTLKKLLVQDKIFCLASDLHKATDRYRLDEVRKKLMRIVKSEQKIDTLLRGNPAAILSGV